MDGAVAWTLGNIRLDPGVNRNTQHQQGHGVHWFLETEEGFWGAPGSSAERTPKFNRHGSTIGPGWKAERTISLTGYAFAPTFESLRKATNTMTALLSDPYQGCQLTCHSEIGDLTCEVFLDGDILTQPHTVATPAISWSLQVVAPDPRKYDPQISHMETGLPDEGLGGLDFGPHPNPADDGLDFTEATPEGLVFGYGSGASGQLYVRNEGTAPTDAVIRLHGPLTNPTVSANGTAALTYNADLPAGSFVEIDPAAPHVLLDGVASRRHLLSPANFAGFEIPASGSLRVGLTHEGPATTGGRLAITYQSAWF